MKPMARRDIERALRANGCVAGGGTKHAKWICACGEAHTARLPRHTLVSPGVIRDTIERMACLPEGWLQ
jgi:hypothetical protein